MSVRGSIWCVVVMLGAISSPAGADEAASLQPLSVEEAKIELARLQDLWVARRGEIHSCDIRYRVYYLVPVNPPLTIEQFEQKLDEYGLRTSPERMNEFMAALCPGFTPKKGTRRIVRDGLLARYEVGDDIKIQDAECQLDYSQSNKTITVSNTSGNTTPVPPIDWLREIPPVITVKPEEARLTQIGSTVELQSDTQIVSRGITRPARNEFQFDATSGIPLQRHFYADGKRTESKYQLALTTTSNGVVFPSFSFLVLYSPMQPGFIDRITFTELVDAQFNSLVPEDTFALEKSRGVNVFDTRNGDRMLDLTDAETDDIRLLIHEPVIIEFQPTPIPWQRRAFFIVNGLILIGLGVWLWRRVSLKEPKH